MEKRCIQCNATFTKPNTCGLPEWARRKFCSVRCKSLSQRNRKPWNFGLHRESRAQRMPCRICGNPTKYHGTHRNHLSTMVHCDLPACVEESRTLKNSRIRHALKGRRLSNGSWNLIPTISSEEVAIQPYFVALGFVPQFPINTGVKSGHGRGHYRYCLDFAHPQRKLYIEIDGSSHRHMDRQIRDQRKDTILSSLGWRGVRISSKEIHEHIDYVCQRVQSWVLESSTS